MVDNVSMRKIRQLYLLEIWKLTSFYPVLRDNMYVNELGPGLETPHCTTGSLQFPWCYIHGSKHGHVIQSTSHNI